LAAAALLALAAPAHAGMGDSRTLVVRGRVTDAAGRPLAGARLEMRGATSMSAFADTGGRYSLTVPIGSAASLERGPFAIELRASANGRRVALAGGASALALEIAATTGTRVRVRSNLRDATDALIAAFACSGEATAWVVADFGAGGGGGTAALREVAEVDVEHPEAPTAAATAPVAPAMPAPGAGAAQGDSATARARPATTKPAAHRAGVADSAVTASRAKPPGAARPAAQRATKPRRPAPADTAAHPVAATPPRPARIRPAAPPLDSCSCRIVGTIEVDWERPLEQDFDVTLSAVGPDSAAARVHLFMGSPREFAIGPVRCGDYAFSIATRSRQRYALASEDSVVGCRGRTQVRVVLVPARH